MPVCGRMCAAFRVTEPRAGTEAQPEYESCGCNEVGAASAFPSTSGEQAAVCEVVVVPSLLGRMCGFFPESQNREQIGEQMCGFAGRRTRGTEAEQRISPLIYESKDAAFPSCRTSAPLQNAKQSIERGLVRAAPGGSAVIALAAAFGGFHIAQQRIHLRHGQAPIGARTEVRHARVPSNCCGFPRCAWSCRAGADRTARRAPALRCPDQPAPSAPGAR